jgi:hypothetical protein
MSRCDGRGSVRSRVVRWSGRAVRLSALAALGSFSLNAALIIDAGPSSNLQSFSTGSYVAGTEFTTATTLTIRALGALDPAGTGLVGDRPVGLWDTATQALLASVTVTPFSPTVLSAQGTGVWYMGNISDLVIGPGTYRVASWMEYNANALSNDKLGIGVTLTSGYIRTDFPSGGFAYPNLTFGAEAIRATASTSNYEATPIPEPASIALAGLGLGLLVFLRRRISSSR